MALEVTYDPVTGTNNFKSDGIVVFVGPDITGHVTLDDGTRYNVTPHVVEVASEEHAAALAHEVGKRFANEGHPQHEDGDAFVYLPPGTPEAASPVSEPAAQPAVAPIASSTED